MIFDLDGTLVDSEPVHYETGRRLLVSYIDAAPAGIPLGRPAAGEVARGKPEAGRAGGGGPPRRNAVPGRPCLPETADDPAFVAAGLCFPGGRREFDAEAAHAWLVAGGGGGVRSR